MSFQNRLLLNRAAVSGLKSLEVMLVVRDGAFEQVSSAVDRLGGRVQRRESAVGYLRVEIPTDRLIELVEQNSIEAYQISSLSRASWYRDGPPQANAVMYREFERVIPSVRRSPSTNAIVPVLPAESAHESGYTADEDAGVGQWLTQHPTFDGRGVTIALLETAQIEFAHPILAPATTLDGRDTPKLAGILNALGPDVLDDSRVTLEVTIDAKTSWSRVGDRTYALPRPGLYRFGVFTLPVAINLIQQFGVLEDTVTHELWVDTDGDGDFHNEHSVPDVNEHFEVRFLKLTYPEARDLSFVVARGRIHDTVNVYVARGSHNTMTVSVAAGSKTADGLAYGVAPGARVLLVRCLTPDHRLRDIVEGYLEAAQHPDVDIIGDALGIALPPDTAADFVGLLLGRIVAVYKKPIFHSAGNTQLFLNSVSALGDVFSVGGSLGAPTLRSLFGDEPTTQLMVHPISASGPGIDGALKPDFLAPMQRIAADLYRETIPLLIPKRTPVFRLPSGYQISCCTSASAPYAAGLGALLLSAAKQEHVSYDINTLGRALRVGATFLPGWPAHQQGNGVLDINAAWNELRRSIDVPRIHAVSSITHALAPYAARGARGEGLFERDGWTAGTTGQRHVDFRRLSGATTPVTYRVSWTGNDGTFTSRANITLPLDATVSLPIGITARMSGAHSAILNLHDLRSDAIVFRTEATVVAAEPISPRSPLQLMGSVPLLGTQAHYLAVGERVGALELTMSVRHGTVFAAVLPSHGLSSAYYGHVIPVYGRSFTPGSYHIVLPNPIAGVWTISIANTSSQMESNPALMSSDTAEYTLTARVLAAAVRLRPVGSGRLTVDIENHSNVLRGPALVTSMGTLHTHTGEVSSDGLPNQFEITVPENAATLLLQLRNGEHGREPLELYLYDCTTGECFSYDFTVPAGPEQVLVVRNPKAGRWMAAVNAAPFPTRPGRFVLEEIVAARPQHEPIAMLQRLSGARWTAFVDRPSVTSSDASGVPILLCEVMDTVMNREEEEHPWETRASDILWNFAGRSPAVGRAIYRLK